MALTLKTAQAQDAEALAALVNSAYRGDSSKKGWTTEADLLGGQRTDAEALRETISQPGQVILMMLNGDQRTGKTEPFPYNDERFGIPKVKDLEFVVLEKRLT